MECGLPGNFMLVVSKKFSGGDHNCEENGEHNTADYWVGSPFKYQRGRSLRCVVAGV